MRSFPQEPDAEGQTPLLVQDAEITQIKKKETHNITRMKQPQWLVWHFQVKDILLRSWQIPVYNLTCVAQIQEVAQVSGALWVNESHSLRTQSLFKQVTWPHSPHQSRTLLPEKWRSDQTKDVNQSCGFHRDVLTREWLDVSHLTAETQWLLFCQNKFDDFTTGGFSRTFPVPNSFPLK